VSESDHAEKFLFAGTVFGQCAYCKHARPKGGCEAYPQGIPDAFLTNLADHRRPTVGDHGIRFAPRESTPPEVLAALYRVLDQIPRKPSP